MTVQAEVFESIADSILPFGGGFVAVANLYFDESGTHRGSRLMTIAGYWFEANQAKRFSRDWAKELNMLGLSHAHMTDCALGYGEYRDFSMDKRILSEKRLIENIKRRSRFGFSITIDPNEYDQIMQGVPGAPSCYTFCLVALFHGITQFADANGYNGKLVYLFEAGHESAGEAHTYLNGIPANGDSWVEATRYGGHAFLDKKIALPLQAADMLAWQTRHFYERKLDGHDKPRKDFVALLRPFDLNLELQPNALLAMRDFFLELIPTVQAQGNAAGLGKMAELYQRHNLSPSGTPVFGRG